MAEKTRYTDEELEEFRQIINEKLALAKRDYDLMMASLTNQDSNDVDDTSPTYKALEEGSATQSKEDLIQFAARQQKFIIIVEDLKRQQKQEDILRKIKLKLV